MNPITSGIPQQTYAISADISHTAQATSGSAQSAPLKILPVTSLKDSAWELLKALQYNDNMEVRIMGLSLDQAFANNAMNLISEQPSGNVYRNDFQLWDGSPASVSIQVKPDDTGRYDITGYGMNAPTLRIDIHKFPLSAAEPNTGDMLAAPEAGRTDVQSELVQARIKLSVPDAEMRGVAAEEKINAYLRKDDGTQKTTENTIRDLRASGHSIAQDRLYARNLQATGSASQANAQPALVDSLLRQLIAPEKRPTDSGKQMRARGEPSTLVRARLRTSGLSTNQPTSGEHKHATQMDINSLIRNDDGTMKTLAQIASDMRARGLIAGQNHIRQLAFGGGRTNAGTSETER